MDKVIIYTAITNAHDQLHEFPTPYRKIVFTERQIFSSTWEVKKIQVVPKIFRHIKILPHLFLPPHEKSVWVDGNITPTDLSVFDRSGFWLMAHPVRDCIYQELIACTKLKKDDAKLMERQVQKYRLEDYPAHNGMCSTGVMIRDNNPDYYPLLEMWWEEVKNGSVRDQLSFNYCAWKLGFRFDTFPFLEGLKKWKHNQKVKQRFIRHSG